MMAKTKLSEPQDSSPHDTKDLNVPIPLAYYGNLEKILMELLQVEGTWFTHLKKILLIFTMDLLKNIADSLCSQLHTYTVFKPGTWLNYKKWTKYLIAPSLSKYVKLPYCNQSKFDEKHENQHSHRPLIAFNHSELCR